jgi:pyruvate dehydrogenase (quinone)/pyruvate oxidase
VAAALRRPGPVLIEAIVDPLEAPMPARITVDQAAHFAEALARGEPDRVAIAAGAIGERIRELV